MENNDTTAKLSLIVSHFALTVISSWAIKYVDAKSSHSTIIIIITLVYGIVGVILYSNPGNYNRRYSSNISLAVQISILVIYTLDISNIANLLNYTIFIVTIVTLVFAVIIQSLKYEYIKMYTRLIVVSWILYILLNVLVNVDDCYWLLCTITSLIFNYLVLLKLSVIYDVPYFELCTIGFCFFYIFALNSINEISQKII